MIDPMSCFYTDNIVCPYCGHVDSDSWEVFDISEESKTIDCNSCGKEFFVNQNISVSYTSKPLAEQPQREQHEEVNVTIKAKAKSGRVMQTVTKESEL